MSGRESKVAVESFGHEIEVGNAGCEVEKVVVAIVIIHLGVTGPICKGAEGGAIDVEERLPNFEAGDISQDVEVGEAWKDVLLREILDQAMKTLDISILFLMKAIYRSKREAGEMVKHVVIFEVWPRHVNVGNMEVR